MPKSGSTQDQIDTHVESGEELADNGDYAGALANYQTAWELISEPKYDHESAWQLLGAIGDTHFVLGDWQACHDTFQQVIRYIGGEDNPFVRLRLGQSILELGNEREALNWMVPAYLMEGTKLFSDDNPKYLTLVKSRLDPPTGGWPDGW